MDRSAACTLPWMRLQRGAALPWRPPLHSSQTRRCSSCSHRIMSGEHGPGERGGECGQCDRDSRAPALCGWVQGARGGAQLHVWVQGAGGWPSAPAGMASCTLNWCFAAQQGQEEGLLPFSPCMALGKGAQTSLQMGRRDDGALRHGWPRGCLQGARALPTPRVSGACAGRQTARRLWRGRVSMGRWSGLGQQAGFCTSEYLTAQAGPCCTTGKVQLGGLMPAPGCAAGVCHWLAEPTALCSLLLPPCPPLRRQLHLHLRPLRGGPQQAITLPCLTMPFHWPSSIGKGLTRTPAQSLRPS